MKQIELRLAEYDLETGKFKSFLELGKDFLLSKEFIYLPEGMPYDCCDEDAEELYGQFFKKDRQDPLKRFAGYFDGRTYGKGRFILMFGYLLKSEECSDLTEDRMIWEDEIIYISGYGNLLIDNLAHRFYEIGDVLMERCLEHTLGNLHENPELWDKLD